MNYSISFSKLFIFKIRKPIHCSLPRGNYNLLENIYIFFLPLVAAATPDIFVQLQANFQPRSFAIQIQFHLRGVHCS